MPYITSGEATKILRVSKRTLFRWGKEGRVKCVRSEGSSDRLYERDYILETAEILKLDRLERKHITKLLAIREKVKRHLFVQDVDDLRRGEELKFMDIDKASEAFNEEEEWLREHQRILAKLFSFPRERLRELLLASPCSN